jgi:hypothetical protein
MSIRARLAKLERLALAGGRCPACRDRPGQVLRFYRRDAPGAELVADPGPADDDAGDACPACGWRPDVVDVVEEIVTGPADPPAAEPKGD